MRRFIPVAAMLSLLAAGPIAFAQGSLEAQFRNPPKPATGLLSPEGFPLSPAGTPQQMRQLILRAFADAGMATFRPELEGGKGKLTDQPWWGYVEPLAQLRARLGVLQQVGRRAVRVMVLLPPDGLAPSGTELAGLTKEIGERLNSLQVGFGLLKDDEGIGNWAAGAAKGKALILPAGARLGADGRQAVTALLNGGTKVIAVRALPEADAGWVEQTFGVKPGTQVGDPVRVQGNALFIPGDLGPLTQILRGAQCEDLFLYPPWPAMRSAAFVKADDPGVTWRLLYNSAPEACHTYVTLYQSCEPELWNPETGTVAVAPGYRMTEAGTTILPLVLPPEGAVVVVSRRAAPSGGDDHHVTQAPGLERVSVTQQGARFVVRALARLNGTHRVMLADGRKAQVEVQRLPTPLLIDGGWSFRTSQPFKRQPSEIAQAYVRALHEGDDPKGWSAPDADLTGWDLAKIGDPLPSLAPVWHAKWLLFNGDGEVRYFRRTLDLQAPIKSATVTITADNAYELYVNGQKVGADGDWYTAETYGVATLLKQGPNVIAVRVSNEGSIAGLLCEASIALENGDLVRVATDKTWRMVKTPGDGWQAVNFDDARWDAPEEGGAPPGASPWGEVPGLPPEPNTGREIWYRIDLPPGAGGLRLPDGTIVLKLWLDGREAGVAAALPRLNGARKMVLVVRGPEPLKPPVLCDSDPSQILPGDWSTQGLAGYVGEAHYDRVIDLPAEYAKERLFLDLGQVGVCAQVQLNGKDAGTRVFMPFVFDLGRNVKPGKNRIHIAVANTLAGADPVQKAPGGIIGPVRIVAYREVEAVVE